MKSESEALFVNQLKENQNIIHKICRLYTTDADAHKDLFQEITIQRRHISNLIRLRPVAHLLASSQNP